MPLPPVNNENRSEHNHDQAKRAQASYRRAPKATEGATRRNQEPNADFAKLDEKGNDHGQIHCPAEIRNTSTRILVNSMAQEYAGKRCAQNPVRVPHQPRRDGQIDHLVSDLRFLDFLDVRKFFTASSVKGSSTALQRRPVTRGRRDA